MLKVSNLTKSFGQLVAVDRLSFEVNEGEIFGFLGPNGAGKTTTIHMICGLLDPEGGTVELDGRNLNKSGDSVRKNMGVVPQEVALYDELNAFENLNFWGTLYGMKKADLRKRIQELLHLTGLEDRARDRVKTYSGGMKRRLNMAAGIVHNPKLLLLDEPTVGIDPQARYNMLETVKTIAQSGTTILYTTHYMDEAESLCDRLAIIDHGRILALGTQEEIQRIVGENRILRVTGKFDKAAAEALPDSLADLSLISISDSEVVYSLPVKHGTGQFIESLIATGFDIDNLAIREPSLDSVFLKLTGRELRD
jgi:ABC-2 type transport system ATP-binding protein